ncbi:hypothetical protein MHH33_14280 [Paenisporosarcina sp. FSL H8-0542]|nr:hypothetical protein [Paenisporosarcina sp. HGH0030]EPD52323.1 hypothetical protein HMPREF1210_01676 [Paenisporosarcina sp. HGH0030]
MSYYLALTIGFILCLAMLGGAFFYFLSHGLKTRDATKIDPK